jgi:ribonuclease-3 family protein
MLKFNENLPVEKVKNMNPVVLAFVGDAVYSLFVRKKLVADGDYKTGALNAMSSRVVCASAQARFSEKLSDFFTEEEKDVFRRGRNAKKPSHAKHAAVADYNASTGFEAVLGYLYLSGEYERLDEILNYAENCER